MLTRPALSSRHGIVIINHRQTGACARTP